MVIVGGGFGGLARRPGAGAAQPVRVTLVDRHNHHVFQPLLYQVATADALAGDIGAPIRWILRRAPQRPRAARRRRRRVDLAARRVVLADGAPLDYDYLIVAPGARHAYFGHPEWETVRARPEDARRRAADAAPHPAGVRARRARRGPARGADELLTFVLVGGGPTGVELAGTLAEITRQTLRDEFRAIDTARARIVVVEAGPSILSSFRDDAARRRAPVARPPRASRCARARASSASTRTAWTCETGGRAASASPPPPCSGRRASRPRRSSRRSACRSTAAGRALVEPDLSIPGHPEVFVVGDAALVRAHAGRVAAAGRGAARDARRRARRAHASCAACAASRRTPFVYRDLGNMAIVGRASAIADLGWIRLSGLIGWLAWLFLHIAQADRLPQPRGRADRVGGRPT